MLLGTEKKKSVKIMWSYGKYRPTGAEIFNNKISKMKVKVVISNLHFSEK